MSSQTPIDKNFALQILQAHIRNAIELKGDGTFDRRAYIADDDEREHLIARLLGHTSKLIESIYEAPEAYKLG